MQQKYAHLLMAGAASFSLAACGTLFGDQERAAGGSTSGQPAQASQQQASQEQAAPPVGEQLVRNVQQQLKAKGIEPGPVDGIWGTQTRDAVEQFQRDQGLQATGQLNGATLSALGITGEQSASAGGTSQGVAQSEDSSSQPSAFSRADVNKNGHLDREEFEQAIKLRQSQSGGSR